jgi:hypothetical protein
MLRGLVRKSRSGLLRWRIAGQQRHWSWLNRWRGEAISGLQLDIHGHWAVTDDTVARKARVGRSDTLCPPLPRLSRRKAAHGNAGDFAGRAAAGRLASLLCNRKRNRNRNPSSLRAAPPTFQRSTLHLPRQSPLSSWYIVLYVQYKNLLSFGRSRAHGPMSHGLRRWAPRCLLALPPAEKGQ